jgi:hypothetical protein
MDVRRREFIQHRLNAFLIDGHILKNTKRGIGEIVRVDMDVPNNILTWWYTKLVLQDYGLHYYKRINVYSGQVNCATEMYLQMYMLYVLIILIINVSLLYICVCLNTVCR